MLLLVSGCASTEPYIAHSCRYWRTLGPGFFKKGTAKKEEIERGRYLNNRVNSRNFHSLSTGPLLSC